MQVYDIRPEASEELVKLGAVATKSPKACATGCDVLVLAVLNDKQVSSVLFDDDEAAITSGAFKGVVVNSATVSPAFAEEATKRAEERGASFIDCPMSGGSIRAARGDLTFMASGKKEAIARARPMIEGMGKLFVVGEKPGLGSSMKMVNQILAGSHIVLAGEAMAFGVKAGLEPHMIFDVIKTCGGNSFMWENRVPHMLDDDGVVHSAVNIWPKDLGIVTEEAKRMGFPVPMTELALQQYLEARSQGHGEKDDSAVVKVYEKQGGVTVMPEEPPTKKQRSE